MGPSFGSDILTLDPHSSRVSFTNAFLANIYETLVRMDDKLNIEPALAVGWERRSPTVWRFHLRPGVTFHGGEAFTAELTEAIGRRDGVAMTPLLVTAWKHKPPEPGA